MSAGDVYQHLQPYGISVREIANITAQERCNSGATMRLTLESGEKVKATTTDPVRPGEAVVLYAPIEQRRFNSPLYACPAVFFAGRFALLKRREQLEAQHGN